MAKNESRHPFSDGGWDDVRLFLAVAETGSVSAAARQLRLGQPTVSRRLAELEEALGYSLFRRHVGGAALTTEGEKLLPAARKMAEWAGEIARASEAESTGPVGRVRITAPPGTCASFLAPFAAWLADREPGILVEALATVNYLDLVRGEADLAFRSGHTSSPDLRVLATLAVRNRLYASAQYAKRLPRKVRLEELRWIAWAPPFEDITPNPQLRALIPNFRPAFTSDNYLVMVAAAEAGAGVMVFPEVLHRFAPKSSLVPLDVDLGPHGDSVAQLVCAKRALEVPRVRVVADLLVEELARLGAKT